MNSLVTSTSTDEFVPELASDDAHPDRVPSGRLLVAVAIGVALGRWLFAANRTIVHAFPDGVAQLAMARWLAGDTPWSMFDHATWQPGLAVLLAPIYWITDDPRLVYRAAIVVNCVLAGISAAVATRLIHRLTGLPGRSCAVVVVVVAMLPASISASAYVWAEPLVTLVFLATVSTAIRFVDHPSIRTAIQPIAWSAVGYLVHGRLLPLMAVSVLLVAVIAWRRESRRLAGFGVVLGAALFGLAQLVTVVVHRAVWSDPDSTNTVGETLRRLGRPLDLLEWGAGQVWYQLVTTAGLFGIGIIVSVRIALPGVSPLAGARSRDARVLLIYLLPLIALSVLFMAGRPRGDHMIYGRYTDAIAWPVIAVAIGWLIAVATSGRHRDLAPTLLGVGLACLATAIVVHFRFSDVLSSDLGVPAMVAGLFPFIGESSTTDVLVPTALAMLVLAVVLLVMSAPRRREALLLTVALGLLVIGALQTAAGLSAGLNSFEGASEVREIRDIVPPGTTIGYHFVPKDEPSNVFVEAQRRGAQLYQMYLPEYRLEVDRGLADAVGPYVFAPRGDPELTEAGAVNLWESDDIGMSLWLEPPAP